MLLTDKGTAYAEGFYELIDGRVINTFTGKSLGILIRKIPSTTYLPESVDSVWKRIVKWWREGDSEAFVRVHKKTPEEEAKLLADMDKLDKGMADAKADKKSELF